MALQQNTQQQRKINILEAKGSILDYLVAKKVYPKGALYFEYEDECYVCIDNGENAKMVRYQPTKLWSHGGPIINQNKINIIFGKDVKTQEEEVNAYQYGTRLIKGRTILESCMRLFVLLTNNNNSIIDFQDTEMLGSKNNEMFREYFE